MVDIKKVSDTSLKLTPDDKIVERDKLFVWKTLQIDAGGSCTAFDWKQHQQKKKALGKLPESQRNFFLLDTQNVVSTLNTSTDVARNVPTFSSLFSQIHAFSHQHIRIRQSEIQCVQKELSLKLDPKSSSLNRRRPRNVNTVRTRNGENALIAHSFRWCSAPF